MHIYNDLIVAQTMGFVFESVENNVGKRENAVY